MESSFTITCTACNAAGASLCYVAGLTCTVCIYCGTLHITETEQYITLDLINTEGFQSLTISSRALFLVAAAMVFIHQNWESVRPNPL